MFRERELHAAAVKQEVTATEAVKRKEQELVYRILREDTYQQKQDAVDDERKVLQSMHRLDFNNSVYFTSLPPSDSKGVRKGFPGRARKARYRRAQSAVLGEPDYGGRGAR